MDNSNIVFFFGCLFLLGLTEKSANYITLCHNDYTSTYDELFSKHGLQYSHKKYSAVNDWDFQTYKRCISPIMNKIFMLRNIPYTIRNPRDLDIQLPKTVYCGLETMAYKGPQLWQQLSTKIKKAPKWASSRTLMEDWDSYKTTMQNQFTFFINIIYFIVDVN